MATIPSNVTVATILAAVSSNKSVTLRYDVVSPAGYHFDVITMAAIAPQPMEFVLAPILHLLPTLAHYDIILMHDFPLPPNRSKDAIVCFTTVCTK